MYYIFWLYSISITSESISPPRELWDLISHFLGPLLYLHHGFFFVFTPNEKATIHIAENIITEEGSKIMVRKTETYQRYADFLNIKCCFILESEEWGRRIWSQNVEALPLNNYHIKTVQNILEYILFHYEQKSTSPKYICASSNRHR